MDWLIVNDELLILLPEIFSTIFNTEENMALKETCLWKLMKFVTNIVIFPANLFIYSSISGKIMTIS